MLLQVRTGVKGFVVGDRYITPKDGPVEVEDRKAGDIVKAGLADPVVNLRGAAVRAVEPKSETARR